MADAPPEPGLTPSAVAASRKFWSSARSPRSTAASPRLAARAAAPAAPAPPRSEGSGSSRSQPPPPVPAVAAPRRGPEQARPGGAIPLSALSPDAYELRRLLRQDMQDCLRGMAGDDLQELKLKELKLKELKLKELKDSDRCKIMQDMRQDLQEWMSHRRAPNAVALPSCAPASRRAHGGHEATGQDPGPRPPLGGDPRRRGAPQREEDAATWSYLEGNGATPRATMAPRATAGYIEGSARVRNDFVDAAQPQDKDAPCVESESLALSLGSHLELLARLLGHAAAGDDRQALKSSLRSSSLQLSRGLEEGSFVKDPSPDSTGFEDLGDSQTESLGFEEKVVQEDKDEDDRRLPTSSEIETPTFGGPRDFQHDRNGQDQHEESKVSNHSHVKSFANATAASSASLDPASPRSPTKRPPMSAQRSASVGFNSSKENSKAEKAQDRLVLHELRSKSHGFSGSLAELESSSESAAHSGPLIFRQLRRLVSNAHFEVFWSAVVLMNILIMILEDECDGMRTGNRIGWYDTYGSNEYMDQWYPNEQTAFYVVDCLFCSMFTVELMMTFTYDIWNARLGFGQHFRIPFWTNPWDLLDLMIVTSSNLALLASNGPMASSRFLRIFRLVRLLRLVRLVRKIDSLDPLHLLTTALRGSAGAFVFSALLLILIQTIFAMGLSQGLRYGLLSEGSPVGDDVQEKLYEYFGTFTRAMVTMFELMLANWPTVCRFLMEEVHEVFGALVVAYKLLVGFGVVGVINGVFIQETFSVAQSDEYIMIRSRLRQMDHHKKSFQRMFKMGDQDRSGFMTREELAHLLDKRAIRTWLEALDLRCTDPDMLFSLISRGEAKVSVDEFICGIARLKGGARNIDVIHVLEILKNNQDQIVKGLRSVVHGLKRSPSGVNARSDTNSSEWRAQCDAVVKNLVMQPTETWTPSEAEVPTPPAATGRPRL